MRDDKRAQGRIPDGKSTAIHAADQQVSSTQKPDMITPMEAEIKVSVEELNPPLMELEETSTQPSTPEAGFDLLKDEWTLAELLRLNVTEIPFLVNLLIPNETLVVLAGQSEIGKSTLYTQLSLAIVRGDEEFLGCKLKTVHKRVLVVSTEDGPIPLAFRAIRQLTEATIDVEKCDDLNFIFNFDQLEKRIERCLEKNPVDLVVVDAFGDVFQGDINASNSVRNFLNKYVSFIRRHRCSILFVHHVCKGNNKMKSEKDQLLGSTGIEGKMRNVLMLSMVNNQHQLRIAKGNYVDRENKKNPMYLDFDSNTLTFSRATGPAELIPGSYVVSRDASYEKGQSGRRRDQELYDQAILLYIEGKSQVEIAKITGKHKSTICKWIKEFKESKDD